MDNLHFIPNNILTKFSLTSLSLSQQPNGHLATCYSLLFLFLILLLIDRPKL